MKTLDELLKQRSDAYCKLADLLSECKLVTKSITELDNEIAEIEDGFLWIVITREWGYSNLYRFNNLHSCARFADKYNGDNGFAYVYTNANDIPEGEFIWEGHTTKIYHIDTLTDIEDNINFKYYYEDIKDEYQKLKQAES